MEPMSKDGTNSVCDHTRLCQPFCDGNVQVPGQSAPGYARLIFWILALPSHQQKLLHSDEPCDVHQAIIKETEMTSGGKYVEKLEFS